ncbi:MAG: hypothetical protein RLZZ156_1631 [Deinococcota bacterium]|jgi:predicted nuclease of predicted toxin-antitoxin system
MRLLFDESVDFPIVLHLRHLGFDVQSIFETAAGVSDDKVLERAFQSSSILVTIDKDFGELIYRLRQPSHGVILLRLETLPSLQKARILESVILAYGAELLGSFAVVTEQQVRIRPLQKF